MRSAHVQSHFLSVVILFAGFCLAGIPTLVREPTVFEDSDEDGLSDDYELFMAGMRAQQVQV